MEKGRLTILIILFILIITGFSIFYYNNLCTVSFDTDGGNKINSIKIRKNTIVTLPESPKKDNHVFIEWQLNGKKFNENKKIKKDITLKAKYLPEIYAKVSFESAGGEEVSSVNVLVGMPLDEETVKIPKREGYNFEGWYLDNDKYNFNHKIVGNITLKAKWIKAGSFVSNNELKIGDTVTILGNYACSAYDDYAYYTMAIGWTGKITSIFNDSNYPYLVSNDDGPIGFFQKQAITK